MKRVLIIFLCLVVGLFVLIALIALIGSRLPKGHVASRSIRLHQSREQVYKVVRDFPSAPSWRSDLKRIEILTGPPEKVRFREYSKHGTVNYELAEDVPSEHMVTRILDTDLGYSGKWTYAFVDDGGETRISIIEDGEVSNVIFRFMSRYVFGQTATMDAYLNALARHFGEAATPQ
jgi:hypothetical protein